MGGGSTRPIDDRAQQVEEKTSSFLVLAFVACTPPSVPINDNMKPPPAYVNSRMAKKQTIMRQLRAAATASQLRRKN
jgi:hypothetical protein